MSLGLKQAGFRIARAFDIDPPSIETHNRNLGNHGIVSDAQEVSGFALMEEVGIRRGDVRGQIGNAVPPVAYGVGSYILRALLVADGILRETQPHALLCEDARKYQVPSRASKQKAALR